VSLLTRFKLALAIIGVGIFAAGVRMDHSRLRLIGIAIVAAAWVLRFVKPRDSAPR
jgi:hypothetical protein